MFYKRIAAKAVSFICAVTMIGSNLNVTLCMAEESTGNEEVTENTEIDNDTELGSILAEGNDVSIHWAVTDQYELVISPNWENSRIPDYYTVLENPDPLSQEHYLEVFEPRPWDKYLGDIISVKICDGIYEIGGYAFNGMNRLENVSIADSVTSIGKNAFSLTSIKSIKLPENLEYINNNLFENCTALETVNLPEGLRSICNYAFSGCTSLKEINLPENLRDVREYAFSDCVSFTELSLPETLEIIGEYAFRGCTGLTSIDIPDSVTSIGKGVFANCSNITDFKFGSGITEIPWMGFVNCTSITQIVLDNDTIKEVSSSAFYGCTALSSVYLGENISIIGNYAFYNCPALTDLTILNPDANIMLNDKFGSEDNSNLTIYGIPGSTAWKAAKRQGINFSIAGDYEDEVHTFADDLTWTMKNKCTLVIEGDGEIPDYTMEDDDCPPWYEYRDSILEVVIGEGITKVGNYAVCQLGMAEELSLPSTLKTIGENAFENSVYREVNIPENVEYIGKGAFYACNELETVNLNCSIKTLESETFSGCKKLKNIDIPESVTSIGNSTFSSCNKLENIDIPESVTSIGNMAFSFCISLNNIKIPDGVTEISAGLFNDCWCLEKVDLPDNIEIIGSGSFNDCTSLKIINLGDNVREIGAYAFSYCTSLTEIKFGSNLKEIWNYAFQNSGLTGNITIPANVSKIYGGVFLNCKGIESYTILNPDISMISWVRNSMGTVSTEDKDNPYVEIPTVFYGYRGSTTEDYANKYSAFTFIAIDKFEKGDVNLDGKVNISDLVLLQNYLVKNAALTDEQRSCADVSEDKNVNVFDAVLLRRKLIESNKKDAH